MNELTGRALQELLLAAAAELDAAKEDVDALNVFPVPDGDTGTNMAATLWSAAQWAERAAQVDLGHVAEAAAQGALFGARGNSGVILSQLLRGFADGVRGLPGADPLQLRQAVQEAAQAAYRAVAEPVEGTMLTVARSAAHQTAEGRHHSALFGFAHALLIAAEEALARTPDLLPVLRECGVVDAGGMGLVVAGRAALAALAREAGASLPAEAVDRQALASARTVPPIRRAPEGTDPDLHGPIRPSEIRYQYCTEFLLRLRGPETATAAEGEWRQAMQALGDSVVVVAGGSDLLRVHVHTDHPGRALEAGTAAGELLSVRIGNMVEQNRSASGKGAGDERPAKRAPAGEKGAASGVVAVASGEGLAALLRDLGAVVVVSAGARKPSVAELMAAAQSGGSEAAGSTVFLPNHPNVEMAAREAARQLERPAVCVPTRTEAQGIAALLVFDPRQPAEANAAAMAAAAGRVKHGDVARASRAAVIGGQAIVPGEWVGRIEGQPVTGGSHLGEVVRAVVERLAPAAGAVISLYRGIESDPEEAGEIADMCRATWPGCEVEVYEGGQPIFALQIAVE